MSISIKKTIPNNINFIKKLETECSLSEWTKQDYLLETNREDSIFLTAYEYSEPVGFILARLTPSSDSSHEKETVEIYNIAVTNKLRRKGIGLKLIKELIKIAGNKGAGSINLEVRKSNHNALYFYKKIGFAITGERKNFYTNPTEDALLMRFELSTAKFL